MKNLLNKKIQFDTTYYVARDNSFDIMNDWKLRAIKEGWTEEEIYTVLDEASMGDRRHLVQTLKNYSEK